MKLYEEHQNFRAGWARRMAGGEFDPQESDDWKTGYMSADFSERTRLQSEPERSAARIRSIAISSLAFGKK